MLLGLSSTAYQLGFSGRAAGQPAHAAASKVRMDVADVPGLVQGQKYGPTAPAHPAVKPWTNLETQEGVQLVKAKSDLLRQPLLSDMANDEIFVSKDSIHILKHHGSYMQQNRDIKKKAERDQSYQFMLRLKVPVGEVSQRRSPHHSLSSCVDLTQPHPPHPCNPVRCPHSSSASWMI